MDLTDLSPSQSPARTPTTLSPSKKRSVWKDKDPKDGNNSSYSSSAKNSSTSSKSSSVANSFSNSVDEEDDAQNEKIIESLTSKYTECEGSDLLGKTLDYLRENIKAGICLVCIEDVGRSEAIWSCQTCYCIMHLVCIQRWAKDSIENVKEKAAERGFNLPIVFCCPKCRNEYSEKEFPDKYKCFCEKVTNPRPDPWNAPHSCGEPCGKPLQPECGHFCLLLCHSGGCPPCPKQVTNTCYCGQSPAKTLRCFSKTWSCGNTCSRLLPCGFHKCPDKCHSGDCSPCVIPTTLHCKCSSPIPIIVDCWKLTATAKTGVPEFILSCGKPCGKLLDCGIHHCSKTCHEDRCGSCERSCPCGKARAPCAGDIEVGKPCGDACEKVLDCGSHLCSQKCHLGSCGSCLQTVNKKCKCGQYEKEILCSKDFTCTTKCRKLRDCKIHPCNKKCCPGDCPPCRNPCGKTLACKNHKCESICHSGPCYPCPVTAQSKCRCGQTIRHVPCGSEKRCKPPDCYQPCTRPTKCEHSKIQNHRCHFSDCPKCRIPCGKTLPCRHQCPAICHTSTVKSSHNKGGAGDHQHQSKPCPPCVQIVDSKCPLHSVKIPCHTVSQRCQEMCGKPLGCNEHYCTKPCHVDISDSCGECAESCGKPRPAGCEHECELGCHEGPCQPCTLVKKMICHCTTEEMFVQCYKQGRLSEYEKSCKNQCPKKLSCGHRCLTLCHSGECPETENCKRKVKLTCRCKHYKKDVECFLLEENKVLECQQGICAIPKVKDTPTPSGKKRTRKKKNADRDKDDDGDDTGNEKNEKKEEAEEINGPKKNNAFNSNLKAISVIAISAFIAATVLKYFGEYIIPRD